MTSPLRLRKRLVIDIGVEADALIGLGIALGSHDMEVVGITASSPSVMAGVKQICATADKAEIPVYTDTDAVKFIIDTVNANPKEITLASMGDMSLLAKAFKIEPQTLNNYKSLVASLKEIDPLCAKDFMTEAERITLIGPALADSVALSPDHEKALSSIKSKPAQHILDIINKNKALTKNNNFILYNPIVIACILKPALCSGIFCGVTLHKDGDKSTIADFSYNGRNNILRIDSINENALFELLTERLAVLF